MNNSFKYNCLKSHKHVNTPDNLNSKSSPRKAKKRSCEDSESAPFEPKVRKLFVPQKPCSSPPKKKFSANDRLMKYRETVQSTKDQVCKVHTLEKVSKQSVKSSDSNTNGNGIFGGSSAFVGQIRRERNTCFGDFGTNKTTSPVAFSDFCPNQRVYSSLQSIPKRLPPQSLPEAMKVKNLNGSIAGAKSCKSTEPLRNCSSEKSTPWNESAPGTSVQNRLKKIRNDASSLYSNGFLNKGLEVFSSISVKGDGNKGTFAFNDVRHPLTPPKYLDDSMDMEWSPVDEIDVLLNVEKIRENIKDVTSHKTAFQETVAVHTNQMPQNNSVFKDLYVVVDTNIFLSHLNVIRNILALKVNGVVEPNILIPWMVIQELDYIKDGRSGNQQLQRNARAAIGFINEKLTQPNSHVKGQTVLDASNQLMLGAEADNNILACCLQVLEKGNRPLLLSNDVNLRNKAVINQVNAYSHQSIMDFLNPPDEPEESYNSATLSVLDCMQALLNYVIVHEMKEAYGEWWEKMGLMKDRPWSLEECLLRVEKYWMAVFSSFLQKQCLMLVQDFRKYLQTLNKSKYSQKTTTIKILEFSTSFCIYLKNGFKKHCTNINDCVQKMNLIVCDIKNS